MSEGKQRIGWLDIAKGIAILCTLIGHTMPYGSTTRNIIFSFHMPLFFVLAGYTFRKAEKRDLWKKCCQDVKRLIVPGLITYAVLIVWNAAVNHRPLMDEVFLTFRRLLWGNGNDYQGFYGYGVLWFLIALFWSRQLYRLLLLYVPSRYRVALLAFAAYGSILIGRQKWLPQCMDLWMVAILFMEFGYQYRNRNEAIAGHEVLYGLAAFFFWSWMSGEKGIYIEIAMRQYPEGMLSVAIALAGCFSVILLSKALEPMKGIAACLEWMGRGSLQLLCIHHLDFNIPWLWQSENPWVASAKRIVLDLLLLVLLELGVNGFRKLRQKQALQIK